MTLHRPPCPLRSSRLRVLLLTGGMALAGALALAGTLAAAPGTAAVAPGGGQAQASPIRHVVVLYLENHSFDSLFGFWCDAHPGRCPDGGMPASVRLSNGAIVKPFDDPDKPPIIKHTVKGQQAAVDGGKMDGWQKIPGCAAPKYKCISGYEPAQIPNLIMLASQFAISDDTFSLADSPSWGGHVYAAVGTLDGFLGSNPQVTPGHIGPGWGCDSDRVTSWRPPAGGELRKVPSCIPDPSLRRPNGGAFEPTPVQRVPSIMDRLAAAGLTWSSYAATAGQKGYGWSVCAPVASCLYTRESAHIYPDSKFFTDAKAGTLPDFSIITPGGNNVFNSWHNGFSTRAGDNWLGKIASAVMNGPAWKSTVLFVTWDDCGCFYDQVRPPVAADGHREGPRLPLVIISPYAKHGYTDTTQASYAGVLAYAEQTFGLAPLGVNDASAYPFTNAFNYHQAPLKPVRMVSRPIPRGEHIDYGQASEDS
jgi:phospholipase C